MRRNLKEVDIERVRFGRCLDRRVVGRVLSNQMHLWCNCKNRLGRYDVRTRKPPSQFHYSNSSPELIRLLMVMISVRFPLSVEDLLFERGIDICHLWTPR